MIKKTNVALLFPGQGSQYVGMGGTLYQNFSAAKEIFQEAEEVLGFNLSRLCFEGDPVELARTENTQPAILTTGVAAYLVFRQEFGIVPSYGAGHSLGEITALTCAGAIKFSDAVAIVRQRGKFMQEAVVLGSGGMAAVSGVEKSLVEEECVKASADGEMVSVSNYNAPRQTVISGYISAVQRVSERLEASGARIIPLSVSAPFHSPLMQPAQNKMVEELQKYQFNDLDWPVISNVTALPYPGKDMIVPYLTDQIINPVRWVESMEFLKRQRIDLAIEMGPKTVLTGLMKQNIPEVAVYSYDNEAERKMLRSILNDAVPARKADEYPHTVVTKCIQIAVCTKNHNWDNTAYQKGVIEPYRKIQRMQENLEKTGQQPTVEQMREALEMLKSVFKTKMTPLREQEERFREVFDSTDTKELFLDFDLISGSSY